MAKQNGKKQLGWSEAGTVFAGLVVISFAIGNITDNAAWAWVGIGLSLIVLAVLRSLGSSK